MGLVRRCKAGQTSEPHEGFIHKIISASSMRSMLRGQWNGPCLFCELDVGIQQDTAREWWSPTPLGHPFDIEVVVGICRLCRQTAIEHEYVSSNE
jgi:hypothetical protein